MQLTDYINILVYLLVLLILSPVLGKYIAHVFDQDRIGWIESKIYQSCVIDIKGQTARGYLKDILYFSLVSFLIFLIIVMLPIGIKSGMSWHLAFNTAISFMSNTNWQAYSGEVALSYIMQMLACTVQNFVSAGVGIAVFIAFTRALRNKNNDQKTVGNFWKDLTRSVLYILLPLSILWALTLVALGVVQTFDTNKIVTTLEGLKQLIPLGPVASQIAIKQLGTNGGGYFGVNSAHPFENPNPIANFFEVIAILLIPCALVFTYGFMLNKKRHAWLIFSVMGLLFLSGLVISLWGEHATNPTMNNLSFYEGKEWRFSKTESVIWESATTAASNGSVNSMHSSMSPAANLVSLFNIMLGEIIFGGVGSGMYGMIMFILLTLFLSGLMVGRTPEYLQKKIDSYDMKLVIIALIIPSCTILIGTAYSVFSSVGLASKLSNGPHGFSEILYAFSSAAGNNGSALAGLNANTPFYNITLGFAMLLGRFGVIIPTMLLAGSFVEKKLTAEAIGQMSTSSVTFGFLLLSVIIILGALTFFPALLLGPVVEYLLMLKGVSF